MKRMIPSLVIQVIPFKGKILSSRKELSVVGQMNLVKIPREQLERNLMDLEWEILPIRMMIPCLPIHVDHKLLQDYSVPLQKNLKWMLVTSTNLTIIAVSPIPPQENLRQLFSIKLHLKQLLFIKTRQNFSIKRKKRNFQGLKSMSRNSKRKFTILAMNMRPK